MDFPRVLVLTSNNFNLITGGGITLTNLFTGWPADRLANLHEDALPPDHTVCQRFYRLSTEEIHWVWPLSLFEPRSPGTAALAGAPSAPGSAVGLSRRLFGDGVPRTFEMSPALSQWIREFQPQVIYSFLGSMAQIRIASDFTKRLNIPLVVHIMDDWPAVIYTQGYLGPTIRRIVMAEFKALVRKARVCLSISEAMSKDYFVRYGEPFVPFHNALDMSEWQPRARQQWSLGKPAIVRYAGSIVQEAQRDSLRDICSAVSLMRARGFDVEMWVHAPRAQRAYLEGERLDGLHLEDSPDPATITELLSSADLLVLPFNFDERSAEYMRLSMPTKVPAYMASGTPTLVYGPEGIATARYALEEGWGYVLFQPGVGNVQAALTRLLSDARLRELHGRRAMQLAAERHDARPVREEFRVILSS